MLVQELIEAVEAAGGIWMLTADHGNCDDMAQRKKDGSPLLNAAGKVEPLTSHTLAPVCSTTLSCMLPVI